jgi:Thiamine pyrophosphate enzyme, N-terminal TPP binding domain
MLPKQAGAVVVGTDLALSSMTMTIGGFLLRRLKEAGIDEVFGVPGDFNLEFMQQLEDDQELAWDRDVQRAQRRVRRRRVRG